MRARRAGRLRPAAALGGPTRLSPGFIRLLVRAWALPTTAVGLVLLGIAVASGGRAKRVEGVIEVFGGLVGRVMERMRSSHGGIAAVTLGHVVLGTSASALAETRAHERVHVAQCERWGPLFLPAYLAAGAWAWFRGGDPYRDNRFERQAFEAEGRRA